DHRWMLVTGVLATAACQLFVAPWTDPGQPIRLEMFFLLATLPALCHGLSIGHVLRQAAGNEAFGQIRARNMLRFVGLASFALAVALGFIAYRHHDLWLGLHRLAIMVALAGMPFVAGGILVQRRLAEDSEGAILRTVGTAIALSGMLLMLIA